MQKYATVGTGMQHFAKVCRSTQKIAIFNESRQQQKKHKIVDISYCCWVLVSFGQIH